MSAEDSAFYATIGAGVGLLTVLEISVFITWNENLTPLAGNEPR